MVVSDTTTNDPTEITEQHTTPDDGVKIFGSIKNTGNTNSMTFRKLLTDVYGVTETVDTVIGPGEISSFSLLRATGVNTASPYTDYEVLIFSTVADQATTYEYHHVQF